MHCESFGKLDVEANTPMPTDAIFRIASQSKALTSVAIMILYEEGKLLLSDPVSKFIPEFKNSRVAVKASEKDSEGYSTVPAKREITIRDLLTHTAGISYGNGPAAGTLQIRRRPRMVLCRSDQADRRSDQETRRIAIRRPARRKIHLRIQHRYPRLRGREGLRNDAG